MDKLFNSVEKSFFFSYFRENNLQFFYLKKLWPHSFLSEKYLDETDLFLLKTVIIHANVKNLPEKHASQRKPCRFWTTDNGFEQRITVLNKSLSEYYNLLS